MRDGEDLLGGFLYVVVDDEEVKLISTKHFIVGVLYAGFYDFLGVGVARGEALAQDEVSGGGDEDGLGDLGVVLFDIAMALHIDIKEDELALLECLLYGGAGGAIVVVMHLRPLEESIRFYILEKGFLGGEKVFASVCLPCSRRARGGGDGEVEVGEFLLERGSEGAFAATAGA